MRPVGSRAAHITAGGSRRRRRGGTETQWQHQQCSLAVVQLATGSAAWQWRQHPQGSLAAVQVAQEGAQLAE
eukprot:3441985-Lingulodinium_polyedra.AAC.1